MKTADVIDTCVLILGMEHIRGGACDPNQAERAHEYLVSLEKKGTKAIVPSVVVAELLNPLNDQQAEAVWDHIDKNFIVAPFDGKAAVLSAKAMRAAVEARKGLAGPDRPTRHEAKVDGMIVGTALARKAERIVSYNLKDFKNAGATMPVVEPPQLSLSQPLKFEGPVN